MANARQLKVVLAAAIKNRRTVLVVGAPGVGKSDIVSQAAKLAGAKLLIMHPVVSDPTDYKGLPFASEGKADFLPFGNLLQLIKAKTLTVCFIDDLGQAPPAVQAACMQLLLARQINGKKISNKVVFIAATNRRQDRAGVSGILEPVKSRFTSILELTPGVDEWMEWAAEHNVRPEVMAFIKFRPNLLHAPEPTAEMVNSPSPRTVAAVSDVLNMELPRDCEREAIAGAAGAAFATEFCGFLTMYRELPNPDTVIDDPDAAVVPDNPSALYAISLAVANLADEGNMDSVATYADRIPAEFGTLLMTTAKNRDKSLMETAGFTGWAIKHSDIFTG